MAKYVRLHTGTSFDQLQREQNFGIMPAANPCPAEQLDIRALHFDTALIESRNVKTMLDFVERCRRNEFPKGAIPVINKAVAAAPGDPGLLAARGWLLMDMGEHGDASDDFRDALILQPDYQPAIAGLGEALGATGRFPEAMEVLKAADAGEEILTSRGVVGRQMGMLDISYAQLEQVTKQFPDFARGHQEFAVTCEALAEKGKPLLWQQAAQAFGKAHKLSGSKCAERRRNLALSRLNPECLAQA